MFFNKNVEWGKKEKNGGSSKGSGASRQNPAKDCRARFTLPDLQANLTQEQLAAKIGTKKSYISRLENGKADIQLSTLYRIFEDGLGKRVSLLIA